MEFQVLQMGAKCRDRATGLLGCITHWIMRMDGTITYLMQPPGLNKEGQPLDKLYLQKERLVEVNEADFQDLEIPFEILGTIVTHDATGFTGMAIGLICHTNGCLHVDIQPSGTVEATGNAIKSHDFDLRACSGEKIPVLTAAEKVASERERPSPTGDRMPHTH